MRRQINEAFGRKVAQALEERGLSLRAADLKTGVSYNTLSRMTMGFVGEMESVVKLAVGLGEPVNEWLVEAGYPPVPASAEAGPSPKERWVDGLAALYQEFQRPIPVSFKGGLPNTHEEVELELADLRRQLEEGVL